MLTEVDYAGARYLRSATSSATPNSRARDDIVCIARSGIGDTSDLAVYASAEGLLVGAGLVTGGDLHSAVADLVTGVTHPSFRKPVR